MFNELYKDCVAFIDTGADYTVYQRNITNINSIILV